MSDKLDKYDKVAYNAEYNKSHYSRVGLHMQKNEAQELKDYCAARGVSVNSFVVDLIRRAMAGEI